MIDQLSATADCRQQMTLETSLGSAQWPTIVRVSERWDATSLKIVACSAIRSLDFSNPWFPVSFSDTMS